MQSYQMAKMPPPVPPKYRQLTAQSTAYQNENVFENGFNAAATGGALIQTSGMRVKIRINPENPVCSSQDYLGELGSNTSHSNGAHVKIKVNGDVAVNCADSLAVSKVTPPCTPLLTDNLLNAFTSTDTSSKSSPSRYLNGAANGYQQHCASGQSSPSDNLDSGTCSDVDAGTPPPPPYSSPPVAVGKGQFGVAHQRSASLNSSGIGVDSDVDDEVDNVSCDSIDSSEYNADNEHTLPIISAAILKCNARNVMPSSATPSVPIPNGNKHESRYVVYPTEQNLVPKVAALTLTNGKRSWDRERNGTVRFEEEPQEEVDGHDDNNTDRFLHFHLNENRFDELQEGTGTSEDDSFAGFKSLIEKSTPVATIRSAKGTVRGVKNRVRAGIATFLNTTATKTWQEKEAGKVVVYTTTMGIVRETYHRCLKVRQILRTHLIKFEEKDVFMSREVQKEIRERMNADEITVPQVFVEGIHVGDAETIDRLNESGELRQILKPYKSADALSTCQVCGGYRLLPCNLCNGSKKSIHRNHFTTELVTLKCMNCDEVGLIRCYAC